MKANSFSELLEPIPNAVAVLKVADEAQTNAPASSNMQLAEHHHHHHHVYRRRYRHHHHYNGQRSRLRFASCRRRWTMFAGSLLTTCSNIKLERAEPYDLPRVTTTIKEISHG
jgi:hypothetical protein